MDTASVIICTYNKPSYLLASLASFNQINYDRSKFEVIVCDDGSIIGLTKNQLESFKFNLRYYRLPHKGRSHARNYGLQKAKGDIIVFSDDDTLVPKEFLSKHVMHHQSEKSIMVIGNRKQVYLDDKKINDIYDSGYVPICQISAKDDIYSLCSKTLIFRNSLFSPHWICTTTANMSVSKSWIDKYGAFDEDFCGWGFEDVELGYRYSKHGLIFMYDSGLESYHMEHARNRAELISEMCGNIYHFYNKYNKAEDIRLYWDFFRGAITLEEFDKKTFNVLEQQTGNTIFPLFIRSRLPALEK